MQPRVSSRRAPRAKFSLGGESGQAALLLLGVVAAVLVGVLILFGIGQALGAKGRHQRAADLAAVSAAQVMRELYPRLFEPAFLPDGARNPGHLSIAAYLEHARAAAVRAGERNGVPVQAADVSFPGGSFAPTRVTVAVHGQAALRLGQEARPRRIEVRARATAGGCPSFCV